MITTDKVYRNLEHCFPYKEDDTLGGHDPYSASKAASEIVISSYRDSFFVDQGVAIASARAGNVIGGGDWSEDRLIPDAVRAWNRGETLIIRNPKATRPWQHVLEPLSGYIILAQKLWQQPELAGAFNFGPHTHEVGTVETIVNIASSSYGFGSFKIEKINSIQHEAGILALENAKVRHTLNITPKWGLAETVQRTMSWYKSQLEGVSTRSLCEAEIGQYEALL
jgi:CDP-glucose 4,6-dehydratase